MEPCRVLEAPWETHAGPIKAIRFKVFVEEQHVPPDLELDGRDPACRHVLAEVPGRGFVGTGRLLPDGRIGRLAVLADCRGAGIGRAMMERLLSLARAAGFPEVILHAQEQVVGFYAGLGFRAEGERFFEAGIPHRLMRLPLIANPGTNGYHGTMTKRGSAIILLLFGIVIIGFLAAMVGRQGVTTTGTDPRTAIDRGWEARCLATKATISQALQVYAIQNEPMKTLDLNRLIPGGISSPQGCPCSYTLDLSGNVVCRTHH